MTSRSNRDVGWARHGESRRRKASLRDAKGQVASALGKNPMPRTSFDEFFDEQMTNPEFAEAYRVARSEIDQHDAEADQRRTRIAVDKGTSHRNK